MTDPYAPLTDAGEGETTDTDEATAATDRLRLAALRQGVATTMHASTAALRRGLAGLRFADWLVVALTLGIVVAVGTAVAGSTAAGLAVASGFLLAVTLAATNSDNPLVTGFGVVTGSVAGVATLAMTGVALSLLLQGGFRGLFAGLGVLSLGLASLGAFLTPVRTLSAAATVRTSVVLLAGALGAGCVVAVRLLPQTGLRAQAAAATVAVSEVAVSTVLSVAPTHALATFFIVVSITFAAVGHLLETAPIERLLPPDRRQSVTASITTIQHRRSMAVRITVSVGVLVALGLVIDAVATGQASTLTQYTGLLRTDVLAAALPSPVSGLVGVVTAPAVRAALLGVTLTSLAASGLLWAIRSLRRGLGWTLVSGLTPLVAGGLTALPVGVAAARSGLPTQVVGAAPSAVPTAILTVVETAPPVALGGITTVVLLGVTLQPLGVVTGVKTVPVLPTRAGSAAIGSVGLFGGAVAAVLVDLVGVAVLAAAAGLCVWDLGEFAAGIDEELSAGAPTLRAEAVHAAGSLLYCSVAAVGAWLLYQVAVPRLTPPAADIAAVGVLLSLGVAALLAIRVSAP